MRETYPKLYPGDIGAVRGSGPLLWFSQRLLEPKTDRIHHLLIGDYLPWDDDYVILESIGKGIAVGRLSFYKSEDIEIYRVNLDEDPKMAAANMELRQRAAAELTRLGRASYDYILYLELVAGGITLLLKGKLPPWKAKDLPYGRDRKYICTEAANFGWRAVNHPVIEPGVVPTPSGYRKAYIEGKISRIFPAVD